MEQARLVRVQGQVEEEVLAGVRVEVEWAATVRAQARVANVYAQAAARELPIRQESLVTLWIVQVAAQKWPGRR